MTVFFHQKRHEIDKLSLLVLRLQGSVSLSSDSWSNNSDVSFMVSALLLRVRNLFHPQVIQICMHCSFISRLSFKMYIFNPCGISFGISILEFMFPND